MVRRAWRLRRARRAGGGRRRRLRSHRPSGHSDPLGAGRRWAQMARGPSSVGDGGVSTLTGARQPVLTRRQVRAVPPGGGDSPGRQGRAGDLSCGAGQDRFCAKTAAAKACFSRPNRGQIGKRISNSDGRLKWFYKGLLIFSDAVKKAEGIAGAMRKTMK